MYITQWSDPDIGSAGDDLVGVDTLLNLGYAYNGSSNDPAYSAAGLPPPACGYDFLSGPIVVGDPNDIAVFGLKKRRGFRNLRMTSFIFIGSGGSIGDPSLGVYNGTLHWWNLLRGFLPRPVTPPFPWIDPTTGLPVKFMVPGDPVSGTGWLDLGQGDRRMQLISGPFTMAVGDTQEIVVAALTGLGSDRLTSISVLKVTDRIAQAFYDELTRGAVRPPILALQATGLDRKVVLSWPDIRASIANSHDYEFEGYNVYQGESAVGPWHRVATFDIINNIKIIFDQKFDPKTGLVLNLPVQFGSDSGIQHFIEISEDIIEYGRLVNGRAYYFGVSSYLYNAHNEPNALESVIATIQVTPFGKNFSLSQNYPNPFNPETTIPFQLPQAGHVVLRIFNTLGQEIRKLADSEFEAGFYRLVWDGKAARGRAVSSGLYFYQLQADDFIQVKKMTLLR